MHNKATMSIDYRRYLVIINIEISRNEGYDASINLKVISS